MDPKIYEQKNLEYKGKVIFSKIVIGEFSRFVKYFQEDEACFMFVDQGKILMRTPKQLINFEAGDGMIAKCGNYFFEQHLNKDNAETTTSFVAAYFYPSVLKEIFKEKITTSSYNTNYDATKIKIDTLLSNFKDNISFLLDNPEIADETLILTKLKEFLILLSKTEKAPSVIDFISSLFKPIESHFKTIIEKHILSNLSLNDFATLCGMSLATFKRKFQEVYHESPRKYISKKKLEKALQMLSIKENRIADVAYDCGFDSITTFNRNFKNHFNQSPTNYRNDNIELK